MSLIEWLQKSYGIDIDADGILEGEALAAALYRRLVAAGMDYGEQRHLLLQASDRCCDPCFGTACLDQVERINAFLARRATYDDRPVRNCHSGVTKNKQWAAGAEYAELRFVAARKVDEDSVAAVEGMNRQLVAAGYIEAVDYVVRDLRQGLGYLLPGEDPVRRRRTVRWLRGLNALHFWVEAMLGGREPLIRAAGGAQGCWKTAADLFLDKEGHALTNQRLEHGLLRNEEQRRQLLSLIPRTPKVTALIP